MLRRLRIENLVLIREADLEFASGLNAITGETGAGKTIFASAIGLLLGAKGDAAVIGAGAREAYVEAEFDVPEGLLDDESLQALEELRPEDEPGLVVARRIFPDGRTRAYAWGRAAAREDVAAAVERLLAMSGQFEQRRLSRPSYQLDVLDAYAENGDLRTRAREAWRDVQAARKRHDALTRDAAAEATRIEELRLLVESTAGFEPETEDDLRARRERLRHVGELAEAAQAAAEALTPEDGDGALDRIAAAERSVAPLERLAPELERAGAELRDSELRLRDTAAELRGFLASLDAEPGALEELEGELERIADAKRRFGAQTYEDLLALAASAGAELAALDEGVDPAAAAAEALAVAERLVAQLHAELAQARRDSAEPFAEAVAANLRDIGMGEGEFRVELRERDAGPTGADEAVFLIRPNAGHPFAPAAETASGGELSRVALAIAAVAGGETIVFDEIDAGIGGVTANAVGELLRGLDAQVLTITHLPQIANLAERHFRVEKVAGDPTHTQIQQLDDAERRDELERMLGGREFLATLAAEPTISRSMSFVEFTGNARLGRRTKVLTRRLGAADIAIIDHADLDRVSAEELLESGVQVVVNVADSQTGRFPNPGPLLLVRGGVRLIDAPGAGLFDQVNDGELLTVRGPSVFRNGTCLATGNVLGERDLSKALNDQRGRVTEALEEFAENTMRYLREEGRLLAEGVDFPALETRFRDRHALVVARGPGHKRDLRMVRPYVRDFRPVLIGVDGGADALREEGLKPDVIVGDMDSVTDETLRSGAELVVHAYADGTAPGAARCELAGVPYNVVRVPGISEDIAFLLAYEKGAELIVAVGTHLNLVEFLERNRSGMASTFVTRLKVGEILVDAKGVSRLVRERPGLWPLALLWLAALAAIVVAIALSPSLRRVIELLAQKLFG